MDYYLNEELSDVWFVVEGVRIPAFKALLSFKSEVFKAMFSGKFADSGDKEINVSDSTVEAVKDMLRFLHKEELVLSDEQSLELTKDVYKLANYYRLVRLMDALDNHFKKLINAMTLKDICTFAYKYDLKNLMEISKKFLANNIDKWVDRDMNELFVLNAKTNNTLMDVIVKKYRQTRDLIGNIYQNQYNLVVYDRSSNAHLFTWNVGVNLTEAIKLILDINKL